MSTRLRANRTNGTRTSAADTSGNASRGASEARQKARRLWAGAEGRGVRHPPSDRTRAGTAGQQEHLQLRGAQAARD
eukprot:5548046-Lingulodinium_polyedra.AAC.1